jgi:hypothetical protein
MSTEPKKNIIGKSGIQPTTFSPPNVTNPPVVGGAFGAHQPLPEPSNAPSPEAPEPRSSSGGTLGAKPLPSGPPADQLPWLAQLKKVFGK